MQQGPASLVAQDKPPIGFGQPGSGVEYMAGGSGNHRLMCQGPVRTYGGSNYDIEILGARPNPP